MISLRVWASYLYYSSPRYLTAFLVNLAASVLAVVLATTTRVSLQRQNCKLERGLDVGRNGPTPAQICCQIPLCRLGPLARVDSFHRVEKSDKSQVHLLCVLIFRGLCMDQEAAEGT